MNFEDLEPLRCLSMKGLICFQSAMKAVAVEQTAPLGNMHMLRAIQQQSPLILDGLDLSGAGIDVAPIPSDWPQTDSSGGKTIAFDSKPSPDFVRAMQAAFGVAKKYRLKQISPIHIVCGIVETDPELGPRLARAGATSERLESMCQLEGRTDTSRIPQTQTGIAYDLHRLVAGRKFILGGLELEFEKGPAGHSDGDVLSHAICDALLGAGGLGDIGTHFPDTDAKWKGASSLVFLEQARKLLDARGCRIKHIDAVVITERPKLTPHFAGMRAVLARALGIDASQINLKAKTNEGVDAIGRGEAIAAHAVATIES
jgi:2-C-methyl-D-erythritol 2,4-cyclodiphosphate synthase